MQSPEYILENETHKLSWDFEIKNGLPKPVQMTRPYYNQQQQKQKEDLQNCGLFVEYDNRHGWVGMVIHWKMSQKLKFDYTNKWYMHNPASVLEKETHKPLCDFDIQKDPLISSRRPDLIIIDRKRELTELWTFFSRLTTEFGN